MARKTRLSKLRVDEVSLVDNPANPASRALIAKRATGEEDIMKGCNHGKGETCAHCDKSMKKSATVELYMDALNESIESIMGDDSVEDKTAEIGKSVEQFRKAMATVTDKGETMADKNESILKSLSPEQKAELDGFVQKAVEAGVKTLSKRAEDLEKRAEQVEKQNKELTDEIAKRDRVAKAKTLVGDLPIDVAKMADVLAKVGTDKEVESFVADLVTKYRTAIQAGSIFQEVGSTAREELNENSSEGKVEKRVQEIRKNNPKVTQEAAYAQAITEMPELYEEALSTDSE